MTVTIACTHCQASLSMPESMAGRQVRCPKCQQVFTCPQSPQGSAAPKPEPPKPEPPKPEPRKRPETASSSSNPFEFDAPAAPASTPGGKREEGGSGLDFGDTIRDASPTGWNGVRVGGLFILISAGVFYLAFAGVYLLTIGPKEKPKQDTYETIVTVAGILVLIGVIVSTLGLLYCTKVPRDSGARGPAATSAFLMLFAGILGCLLLALRLGKPALTMDLFRIVRFALILYMTSIIVSFIAFQFYLVLVGTALRRRSLTSSLLAFPIVSLGFFFYSGFRTEILKTMQLPSDYEGRMDPSWFSRNYPVFLMALVVGWFYLNIFMLMKATGPGKKSQPGANDEV